LFFGEDDARGGFPARSPSSSKSKNLRISTGPSPGVRIHIGDYESGDWFSSNEHNWFCFRLAKAPMTSSSPASSLAAKRPVGPDWLRPRAPDEIESGAEVNDKQQSASFRQNNE
jgi:hypothetical protein